MRKLCLCCTAVSLRQQLMRRSDVAGNTEYMFISTTTAAVNHFGRQEVRETAVYYKQKARSVHLAFSRFSHASLKLIHVFLLPERSFDDVYDDEARLFDAPVTAQCSWVVHMDAVQNATEILMRMPEEGNVAPVSSGTLRNLFRLRVVGIKQNVSVKHENSVSALLDDRSVREESGLIAVSLDRYISVKEAFRKAAVPAVDKQIRIRKPVPDD